MRSATVPAKSLRRFGRNADHHPANGERCSLSARMRSVTLTPPSKPDGHSPSHPSHSEENANKRKHAVPAPFAKETPAKPLEPLFFARQKRDAKRSEAGDSRFQTCETRSKPPLIPP